MFVISTRNFPPDLGGMQNLMSGLCNALLEHGPVKVFAEFCENSEEYDKKSKIDIQRISGFKIFRKYRKANLISEYIKKNDVRAIFFDHWKSIENINNENLINKCSFCLIHSKEINHEVGSSLNKRMIKSLNKSSYIIANSHFTKKLAIKLGINEKKIHIINPGSDYPIPIKENFKKQAKDIYDNSFPKIITIARLDKRKSHQNILMTIKNLLPKFPNLKYISIGDGDEKENLSELRDELGLQNNVIFIHKSEEQLKAALLNESDLFLMPSVVIKKSIEGFGISFIEAASYGKGSIGGIHGGEADAIKQNKTGMLCDGNNLDEIYQSVINFFENDKYKFYGKNALEFSKNFKWKNIIKSYLKLI
ncbi:MAG: glycosyl transferase [Pelagibacteraceae bacterium TMED216]|nr:MAG: glycosyl transferase [Pelagibacteraceae bacterium TMED216]|tara:strand:+ start:3348 stop:4439 length:1092 start_codon:yes stop_codon:yes gene_type:complete